MLIVFHQTSWQKAQLLQSQPKLN